MTSHRTTFEIRGEVTLVASSKDIIITTIITILGILLKVRYDAHRLIWCVGLKGHVITNPFESQLSRIGVIYYHLNEFLVL